MKRFQVIERCYMGGYLWRGESDTLRGAKMLASRFSVPWKATKRGMLTRKPTIYLASYCKTDAISRNVVPVQANTGVASHWDGKTWEDFSPVFGEI